jgi:uncharacterized membrane protein YhiD involved in acid resistance
MHSNSQNITFSGESKYGFNKTVFQGVIIIDIWLQLELGFRLVFALFMGAVIGSERRFHNKPAGARTHGLVCLASALFMIISIYGFSNFDQIEAIRRDPARIAAQVISGMGFIGAGVIWKEGFNVRGLTTATTLWLVSGLGLACGCGMYIPALITVILAYIALSLFNIWETVLSKKRGTRDLKLQLKELNLTELQVELEEILEEPLKHEVSGQPDNIVIMFEYNKSHYNDPFDLSFSLKEDILQIISLRLPKSLRGRGLGSNLCQHLIQWAKENGSKKISVISKTKAINFWIKNGFRQIDEKTFVFDIASSTSTLFKTR